METFGIFASAKSERIVSAYKSYFRDFIQSLTEAEARKVFYVIDMLKTQERINSKFVKYLRDEIYELRVEHNGNIFRVFFIFDEGNVVMLFNGFQKKTQKTPQREIDMAIRLKKNIMQERNDIMSVDAMMDERFGKVGTPEREAFRKEAYAYCVGQIIREARKREKVTQQELAQRMGTNKSYISRIEKGSVEPGAGMFLRILGALGLRFEVLQASSCR